MSVFFSLSRPVASNKLNLDLEGSLSPLSLLLFSFLRITDWMNSPLVGGGVVPDGETEVFFSSYLDRVLSLDEQKYVFDVSMYVFLSWIDPRAPGEVAKATNETTAEGGRDCARLCVGQRAPSEVSQCCDSMWLPSFVIRNADEMPQGRLQPYYITVDSAGVVTWRVQFRSDFYTSLNVQAFPFDTQVRFMRFSHVYSFAERGERGREKKLKIRRKNSLSSSSFLPSLLPTSFFFSLPFYACSASKFSYNTSI